MAPETQFSAGKIIDAAIGITRAHGIDAVTARSIAKELGCSVKPIFTAFDNMDDAIEATVERARSIFTEFMQKPYEKLSFMRIGLRWIDFARTEPNLSSISSSMRIETLLIAIRSPLHKHIVCLFYVHHVLQCPK